MSPSAIFVMLAALALALGIWHLGRQHPGYSHIRHTISELGETGAANARRVAYGVFLPFGLAMLAVYGLSRASHPSAADLAACLAVGYVGAALFPCDPGSPLTGSWRQSLHNLAGAVQYVGGAVVIWRMAPADALLGALALLVGAVAVLLSVPALGPWRGGIQRVGEAALLVSLALAL